MSGKNAAEMLLRCTGNSTIGVWGMKLSGSGSGSGYGGGLRFRQPHVHLRSASTTRQFTYKSQSTPPLSFSGRFPPTASSFHSSSSYKSPSSSLFSKHQTQPQFQPSLIRHFSTTKTNNCPPTNTMAESERKELHKYLQASHDHVFENNRKWAAEQKAKNPEFFETLSAGQSPEYLWIGCSDSRIPAEAITGLGPGEMFIHRNIANLVCNTDLNVMSVVNYAVRHLHVKHIVVCGHYGCGGVKAAMTPQDLGLLNPWLRNIRDVYRLHEAELDTFENEEERYDRLVELNVVEQCRNIIKTAAVQQSYAEKEFPIVHGWVFGFKDGLLKDLKVDHEKMLKDVQKIYNLSK